VTFYDAFRMNEHPFHVSDREKYEVFKMTASSSKSFKLRIRIFFSKLHFSDLAAKQTTKKSVVDS